MAEDFRNPDAILDIGDKPKPAAWLGLSLQHLFSMFGATVLVPIMVGLDPGVALFSSGLATIVYLFITKRSVPAYLGSSFAFIQVMQLLMGTDGYGAIAQGALTTGLVYLVTALIVKKVGAAWLDKVLPPVVVGPVIMVIGLGLAATVASGAMNNADGEYTTRYVLVALATLALTIFFNMFLKGFFSLIPILLGIVCGYVIALFAGLVDFQAVIDAPWFKLPNFQFPGQAYDLKMHWGAITMMAPIAFVTMTEMVGDVMVINKLTKRNMFEKPGMSRLLLGDGIAQILAGLVGGPPVTLYGENIGVLAITRVHSVYVIGGAGVLAIILSFVGKVSALILSIPQPVISGISFVLFGVIASSGLRILIDHQIDLNQKRNLLIVSVILIIGIGGLVLQIGSFKFSGMALAAIIGIVMNLVLPQHARSEEE